MAPYAPSSTNRKRYTRPIGENETFLKLTGDATHPIGRENWSLNSFATLEPCGKLKHSLAAQLRKAWTYLRFQQPSIATYVAEDGEHFAYDNPDSDELDKWLGESFKIDKNAESAAEIVKSARIPKYWTLTFIPRSSEVLCHTAHWRTDGIGVLQLFDELFKLVADPNLGDPAQLSWGEEVARLTPSIEDVANIPEQPNKAQEELGRKCFETFSLFSGAVGIPYLGNDNTPPGGTAILKTSFDKETTRKVISRCKELEISVTSAVHASMAEMNWHFADEKRKKQHYRSTMRFSFKPYLPEPYCEPEFAASLHTTGWMEKVQHDQSWLSHAKYYHSIYRKGLSKEFIDAYRVYASSLCELLRSSPPAPHPPPSDIDISSIGIIERYMRREYGSEEFGLEVVDVGEGTEIMNRQGAVFVWTFRGRLTCSVVWNEAYHGRGQMEAFLEGVKGSVLMELGIMS